MTDLAINLVNTNEHMRKHFISNYEGRLRKMEKSFFLLHIL